MKAMLSILQRKTLLRREMNAIVTALTEKEISEQSETIVNKVLDHPAYKSASSVSIYLSYDKEVKTQAILEDIFKTKKECYIPRFQKGIVEMEMIRLDSMDDYNNLPVNKWNIKQPLASEVRKSVFEKGNLDLVLVPGLAFTVDGIRLGRGKGYYDRFLAKCYQEFTIRPFTLALAFKEQIIPHLPSSETDIQIDCVLFHSIS